MLVVLCDLAADVHLKRSIDRVDHLRAVERGDRARQVPPVVLVAAVYDDVTEGALLAAFDEVDCGDDSARLGDRVRDLAQQALSIGELDADRQ